MTTHADIIFRGDASSTTRAGREAQAAVAGVERSAGRSAQAVSQIGASAARSEGQIASFGRSAGLIFGAAGLAYGVRETVKAFQEQEKANATVGASLDRLGVNNDRVRKRIDAVTLAQQRLSGFADEKLAVSFATLVRSSGDVEQALKDNNLVMDIARARGIDVTKVAQVIAKVYDGNVGILKRYGVAVEKGATVQQALAAAQQRYAGQAKAYGETSAGAAEKAAAEFNNLEETIGANFVPVLNQAAGGVVSFSHDVDSLASSVGGFGVIAASAGGFGAVKLLAPAAQTAGVALRGLGAAWAGQAAQAGTAVTEYRGFGGMVTRLEGGTKGVAGGLRGVGRALASTISPLGLAAIGTGLLAGGVYELWKNSESAEDAINGLNQAVSGLQGALDQQATAKDNVKLATINARKADEALADQQKKNRGLHNQLVSDQKDETKAVQAALDAKKKYGSNSKEYTQAYRDATAATSKANDTNKTYQKGLKDVGDLATYASVAHSRLKSAQEAVKQSAGGVADAQAQVDRKITDVTKKVDAAAQRAANMSRNWREVGDATSHGADVATRKAAIFARQMDAAAKSTDKSDSAARTADQALANLAKRLGRIPTQKEIRVVSRYAAQGLNLDQIQDKLNKIDSKDITVRVHAAIDQTLRNPFKQTNPINPYSPPAKPATGAWVAGRYSDGDRVPALLSGQEAVLNPTQQALVDGGMTVRQALAATGAPTIGSYGSYADGGVPIKTALAQKGLPAPGRIPPKPKGATSSKSSSASGSGGSGGSRDTRPAWMKQLQDSGKLPGADAYANAIARGEADLADAQRTAAKSDDIRAYHLLIRLAQRRSAALHGPRLRGAHKEALWQAAVNQEITSVVGQLTGWQTSLGEIVKKPSVDDVQIGVPGSILWDIERAGLTDDPKDDVTAYKRKQAWLKKKLAERDSKGRLKLTGAKATAFRRELTRTNLELASLRAQEQQSAEADQAAAASAAETPPDVPADIQEALADAALTPDTGDDLAALTREKQFLEQAIATEPNQTARIALKQSLASVNDQITSITSGGASGGTGPTPDQEAQTEQLQARVALATRQAALSEAEVAALSSSGDIGTGGYGSALQAGAGLAAIITLADQRSAAAIAATAVRGMAAQAAVPATRETVGVR